MLKEAEKPEKSKKVETVELTVTEMLGALKAQRGELSHIGGNVCAKVDGGVYCQLRRKGETEHLYVKVPDAFTLEVFTPIVEE